MNKKKLKEKRKLNKKPPIDTEDEIFRFIKILLSLSIVIILLFVFTKYVVNDGDIIIPEKIIAAGTVDYNKVVIGTMFKKPEKEYYVLFTDSKESANLVHTGLFQDYKEEGKLPIYIGDLSNKLNKNYEIPKHRNETKHDIELKLPTLLKIKNGSIVEYTTDFNLIKNKLEIKESK